MTNMPITSNKPQSSGNTTNAQPVNPGADIPTPGMQAADPFALLLAQQIGETEPPIPDIAPIGIGDDATNPATKDVQDGTIIAANIPDGPANILAAIMMRPPAPEDSAQKAGSMPTAPLMEDTPDVRPFTPASYGYKKPAPDSDDLQTTQLSIASHPSAESARRAELAVGLAQSTPNSTQPIASQAISTAMPSILTNNISSANTQPIVATPLGNHGWAEEFSQKIRWISTQQNQVAELRLNPPNLGPLDVVLKISDNQATALFASPHGAVRDAVENALPKLREILADNGIMLGNTTISDQSPRDRDTGGFTNKGFGTTVQHDAPISDDEGSASVQTVTTRRHNGMVDTFA